MSKLVCNESTTDDVFSAVNNLVDESTPVVETIVICGASLMNGAFEDDVRRNSAAASHGFPSITTDEQATGGDTSSDTLAALPAILLPYAGLSNVKVILHTGGNEVSNTRPFSTATIAEKQLLASNLNAIIDLIESEGHTLYLANISRRYYSGATEDEGSLPYNENIVEPIIKSRLPHCWDDVANRPVFDMYAFTSDNPSYVGGDGIHLTEEGYTAMANDLWFANLSTVMVSNVRNLYHTQGMEVVVDVGGIPNSTVGIYDSTSVGAQIGTTLTVDGGYIFIHNQTGVGALGRGNAGDTSASLTNDELLISYAYTDSVTTAYCHINNLEPNASGTINIAASRNTTGDRGAFYTIGGNTVELQANLDPPEQASLPFVADEYGHFLLTVTATPTSDNGYLNGVDLVFD